MTMTPEQLEMLKRLKAPIDKYMGPVQIGDMFYNPFRKKIYFVDKETIIIEGCHIIPLFCTPDGKRCLWGMLNEYKRKRLVNGNGYYKIVLTPTRLQSDKIYAASDPYTAILKALCEQENV
jgi:hypothetical protein